MTGAEDELIDPKTRGILEQQKIAILMGLEVPGNDGEKVKPDEPNPMGKKHIAA